MFYVDLTEENEVSVELVTEEINEASISMDDVVLEEGNNEDDEISSTIASSTQSPSSSPASIVEEFDVPTLQNDDNLVVNNGEIGDSESSPNHEEFDSPV